MFPPYPNFKTRLKISLPWSCYQRLTYVGTHKYVKGLRNINSISLCFPNSILGIQNTNYTSFVFTNSFLRFFTFSYTMQMFVDAISLKGFLIYYQFQKQSILQCDLFIFHLLIISEERRIHLVKKYVFKLANICQCIIV